MHQQRRVENGECHVKQVEGEVRLAASRAHGLQQLRGLGGSPTGLGVQRVDGVDRQLDVREADVARDEADVGHPRAHARRHRGRGGRGGRGGHF